MELFYSLGFGRVATPFGSDLRGSRTQTRRRVMFMRTHIRSFVIVKECRKRGDGLVQYWSDGLRAFSLASLQYSNPPLLRAPVSTPLPSRTGSGRGEAKVKQRSRPARNRAVKQHHGLIPGSALFYWAPRGTSFRHSVPGRSFARQPPLPVGRTLSHTPHKSPLHLDSFARRPDIRPPRVPDSLPNLNDFYFVRTRITHTLVGAARATV